MLLFCRKKCFLGGFFFQNVSLWSTCLSLWSTYPSILQNGVFVFEIFWSTSLSLWSTLFFLIYQFSLFCYLPLLLFSSVSFCSPAFVYFILSLSLVSSHSFVFSLLSLRSVDSKWRFLAFTDKQGRKTWKIKRKKPKKEREEQKEKLRIIFGKRFCCLGFLFCQTSPPKCPNTLETWFFCFCVCSVSFVSLVGLLQPQQQPTQNNKTKTQLRKG